MQSRLHRSTVFPGPSWAMMVLLVSALASTYGFSFPSSLPLVSSGTLRAHLNHRSSILAPRWRLPGTEHSVISRVRLSATSSRQPFGGGSGYTNGTDSAPVAAGAYNDTSFLIVARGRSNVAEPKTKPKPRHQATRKERSAQRKQADRFDRQARTEKRATEPIILTIHGLRYNLTAWAHAHPGGAKILEKYARSGEDAGEAFVKASHSHMAYELLNDFLIDDPPMPNSTDVATAGVGSSAAVATPAGAATVATRSSLTYERRPLWRVKLFTPEDPQNVHKFLGVYSLAHFLYRIVRMLFFDPAAGLTGRAPVGKLGFAVATASLVPHALLSMSSLIFHTVPKERVVGRPMIWQEFRAHNILFGMRSVVCALLALAATRWAETDPWVRTAAVAGSGAVCLGALVAADEATKRLRTNEQESTTATMPYWDGCSADTQRRFKNFYAYSQFMATLACLAVMNPAWPFVVLLPIQLASLLMTLVRKGLLSAKGYHYLYTASLCLPYVVGTIHTFHMQTLDFFALLAGGTGMYALRKQGVNKYALWVPAIVGRVAVGDLFLNWQMW